MTNKRKQIKQRKSNTFGQNTRTQLWSQLLSTYCLNSLTMILKALGLFAKWIMFILIGNNHIFLNHPRLQMSAINNKVSYQIKMLPDKPVYLTFDQRIIRIEKSSHCTNITGQGGMLEAKSTTTVRGSRSYVLRLWIPKSAKYKLDSGHRYAQISSNTMSKIKETTTKTCSSELVPHFIWTNIHTKYNWNLEYTKAGNSSVHKHCTATSEI